MLNGLPTHSMPLIYHFTSALNLTITSRNAFDISQELKRSKINYLLKNMSKLALSEKVMLLNEKG
jgi:hypothetical protein